MRFQSSELVGTIKNIRSTKATDDFTNKINEVNTYLDDIYEMVAVERKTTADLWLIVLNVTVPFISYYTMNETRIGQYISEFRHSTVTGYTIEDMRDNFIATYINTTTRHYDVTMRVFNDIAETLSTAHDEIVEQLADQREALHIYKLNVKMDSDFYM